MDKLTAAQGAVLAAVIKQPQPAATHKGYDPADNPEAAKDRWTYVLNGMVEKNWLPADQKPVEYPMPNPPNTTCVNECGINSPVGNVVNYVRDEMVQLKICSSAERCVQEIRDGGYKITTTIDGKMQKELEDAIWRKGRLRHRPAEEPDGGGGGDRPEHRPGDRLLRR